MKLVVISTPYMHANEDKQINTLFEAGLVCLHLRKPEATQKELTELIAGIDPMFHPRITLHQHHGLCDSFGIGGVHFTEYLRKSLTDSESERYENMHLRLSTSIHRLQELEALKNTFDYAFYGPVFDSISKEGYQALDQEYLKLPSKLPTSIYGIGGITIHNIKKLPSWGYSGAAVLGSIWQEPQKSAQRFRELFTLLNNNPT